MDDVAGWISSEPLDVLAKSFGGQPPAQASVADRLRWFDEFAGKRWDFRKGSERALDVAADLDVVTAQIVRDVGQALGLVNVARPTRRAYDHVLVLGGLAGSCLVRTRYAAALTRDGVATKSVSALTAHRDLTNDERSLLRVAGEPDVADESHLMRDEMTRAFGLGAPTKQWESGGAAPYGAAAVSVWEVGAITASVIVAPSSKPGTRRANTADSLGYWTHHSGGLTSTSAVLVITSPVYVPYQHALAVRLLALPYGCLVETVGADFADTRLGPLRQSFSERSYLQEIRAAIGAVRQLYDEAQRSNRRVS
jgi:hypothetical protein